MKFKWQHGKKDFAEIAEHLFKYRTKNNFVGLLSK